METVSAWSRLILGTVSLLAAISLASAQDIKKLADMQLSDLAEIPVVSAARHEQSRFGSPRSVGVISAEEIRRRNFRNVPEAVGSIAGVYLQQTNYAGGSPIIRGMIGNRILLLLNGIRLNNGTYRLGPNQYLSFIDINQVERIEVVRGAGSILYGSDAFGGVINVITKVAPDPRLGEELGAAVHVRFASADSSGAGRVQVSGASGRFGFVGGVTREQFGDLRAGAGRGVQPYTNYGVSAGDFSVTYAVNRNATISAGIGTLRQSDVPRTDSLASRSDLEHQWDSEGRHMLFAQYSQTEVSRYVSALRVSLGYQQPFEVLRRITASAPQVESRHRDQVHTAEAGVQLSSAIGASHSLIYGFAAAQDSVHSSRTDVNLGSLMSTSRPGNYPDRSRFGSFGIFLQDEVRISSRLDAVLGARYDRYQLTADVSDPFFGAVKVRAAPAAVNGSMHFIYKLSRHVSATGGVAQGFRAPNIDDSTILGGVGSRYEIPNAQLRTERSVNLESGLRVQGRAGNASVVVFEDRYRDLIDRAPVLFRGLGFVDQNGNGIKDGREPDVFQRRNISRADVHGVELEAMVNLTERWTWTQTATWTRGTDLSIHEPMTRIPPLNGASRLTWQSARTVWVEGALVAATGQHRLGRADKSDWRIGPGGTAGYAVVHLRLGLRRSPLAGLSVALENVTNRRYRLHGSGFDRAGINLVLGYTRLF